ncbi:MAG: hypothetical protein ACXACT_14530 [Candidatus Thorarchaeota archaeon]
MPYERFDDAERYSKREYEETPEDPETREIPDEVERAAEKAADGLERQAEVERVAERAARELDEAESRQREVEEAAERAAKELDELENDLDKVRDELHDEYVNDMNRQLEGVSHKDSEVEEGGEDSSSTEMTETTESYEDAGNGMVYAMETKSESETQSEVEGEIEDEPAEQEESTEPIDEVDESPDEKFRNRITRQESPENEHEEYKSSESVEDVEKQGFQQTETNEPSGDTEPEVVDGETRQQHKPELEHEVPSESATKGGTESVDEPAQGDVESEPEESHEVVEPSDESEVYDETDVDELEHPNEPDVEPQNETETQEVSDDVGSDVESYDSEEESELYEVSEAEDFTEELEDFVRRVQELLDEMDADECYDYVQDPLTGEIQRVRKILSEYETEEEMKRKQLRNLFARLTEEEREQFKNLVKVKMENEDDFARQVEQAWKETVEKAELVSDENILLKALANERFYFEEVAFDQFLDKLQKKLGCSNRKQLIKYLNEQEHVVSTKVRSIRGDALNSYLEKLDESLEDFEGKITKITGKNGQGGFENPRFPSKQKLRVLISRLGAIVNSDCYLRKDGCIFYYERHPERIDRVEKILREFGDIRLQRTFRREHGRYTVVFPRSLGRAFIYWGFTYGDKPIQNRGLSQLIHEGGEEIARPYFEELISEDGSFNERSGFSWSRSVVLNAGKKNSRYDFKPIISQEDIQFVKDNANVGWEERNIIGISMPKLKGLMESENKNISDQAQNLMNTIRKNPSNLIMDEADLARSLGIHVDTYPKDITYSKTTGRFSVNWAAYSFRKKDKLRWGLLAPPNDERKKKKLDNWFAKHTDDVEQMRKQLESEGFELE